MKTIIGPKDIAESKTATLFFDQDIPDGVSLVSVEVVDVEKKPTPKDGDPPPSGIVKSILPVGKNALLRLNKGGEQNATYKIRALGVDSTGDEHIVVVECRVEKF